LQCASFNEDVYSFCLASPLERNIIHAKYEMALSNDENFVTEIERETNRDEEHPDELGCDGIFFIFFSAAFEFQMKQEEKNF